jgi:hypothetical protein
VQAVKIVAVNVVDGQEWFPVYRFKPLRGIRGQSASFPPGMLLGLQGAGVE